MAFVPSEGLGEPKFWIFRRRLDIRNLQRMPLHHTREKGQEMCVLGAKNAHFIDGFNE